MTVTRLRGVLLLLLLPLLLASAGCAIGDAARKQASYHFQMGLSHLGENNATSALIELTEAEKLTPEDPELLNYLGLAYYYKGKFELAEHKYLKALSLKPVYSDARNNLGVNYLELKRWDDAIYQLKMVTDDIFYQNQESATLNLGLAYFGKGDYPRALSVLRSLAGNNPKNPRARLNLGKVYLAIEKYELAIMEFSIAIELSKDYANAHYSLGLAYLKTKDDKAATASFREVLRIAPNSEIGQLSREYLDLLK